MLAHPYFTARTGKIAFVAAMAALFALAAWLRFDFILSVSHHVSHDTVYYDIMVRQLLEHGVYGYKSEAPNAQVPPGFPLFMALVYLAVDYKHHDPYPFIRGLQVLMSLATMAVGAALAARLGGRWAALAAVAAMAVYPPFVWANGAVLTETLAALLIMLYLYVLIVALEKRVWWISTLAGAILGLATLTRSEFAVLLPAAYLGHWALRRIDLRSAVRLLLAAALGAAIVCSPWVIRNLVTLHKPIIASTQVNPFAAGTYPNKNYDDGLVDRNGKTQMEVAKERLRVGFTEHTWTYVRWFTVGKLQAIYGRMFGGAGHKPFYPVIPLGRPFHLALVYGGLLGGALQLRRWRSSRALPIVVAFAVITVTRLAFVPEYRYNFTAMPMLIVLAGLLVAAVVAAAAPAVASLRSRPVGEEAPAHDAAQ